MDNERVVRWPTLRFVNSFHGIAPRCVGTKTIDCFCWEANGYAGRFEVKCGFLEVLEATGGRNPFLEGTRIFEVAEIGGCDG